MEHDGKVVAESPLIAHPVIGSEWFRAVVDSVFFQQEWKSQDLGPFRSKPEALCFIKQGRGNDKLINDAPFFPEFVRANVPFTHQRMHQVEQKKSGVVLLPVFCIEMHQNAFIRWLIVEIPGNNYQCGAVFFLQ